MTFEGEQDEQDPTVHLWMMYFVAQHFYFKRNFGQALHYVNQAIEHTPTVVDLYVLKAKLYKSAGDPKKAAILYDEARKLDLADRYLNAVASRYLIRNDQLDQAEKTMAMYSKDAGDDNGLNVHDMQCMWYETECAASYLRKGNLRLALKNYNYIEKHFDQIYEDQFDFHLYSMRKFTLNSYFEMIDMEDRVYRNKYAVRAAIGMMRVAKKASGINAQEEVAKLKPEVDSWKESKEYKKLQEEIKKQDDDNDYRIDVDPKGFELYEKFLADPVTRALDFATLVAKYNPDAADLQAKLIPLLL